MAIVERRSVLIAKQDLNITDEAIKRIDALYRDEIADDVQPGSSGPIDDQGGVDETLAPLDPDEGIGIVPDGTAGSGANGDETTDGGAGGVAGQQPPREED